MHPQRRTNVTARVINGESVVLDRASGQVHSFNVTARAIWDACDGARSTAEIERTFAAQFGVPKSVARKDVMRTVRAFRSLGLLVERADNTGER